PGPAGDRSGAMVGRGARPGRRRDDHWHLDRDADPLKKPRAAPGAGVRSRGMQTRQAPRSRPHLPLLLMAAVLSNLLVGGLARAADCPATPPAAMKDRRSLAKEWFARAETEELGGDDKA